MAQKKSEKFLTIMVFGLLLSVLGFYIYNLILGSGSVTGLLYMVVISIAIGVTFFFSLGITSKTVDLENFIIFLIVIGLTGAFFMFIPDILPGNFSVVAEGLKETIPKTIGSLVSP